MHIKTLAIAACMLSAAVSLDGVNLVYTPEADTSRTTTIEAQRDLEGGELTVVMGGQEIPAEFLPELNLVEENRVTLSITETFVASGEAGPTEWLRRYDEVTWNNEGSMSMSQMETENSFPWEAKAETPFTERVIRFSSDDGEEFARELADDGDEIELDGLQASLGLSELLPEEPVDVGGQWKVDGKLLGMLFEPGGDFSWELDPEAAKHMLPEVRERSHSGELTLVLSKISEEDGARIAFCSVDGDLVRTTVQAGDLSEVPVADGTATDTIEEIWGLGGELRWDLTANHVISLSLEGELVSSTHTVRDPDQPGAPYESTFTVEGSYSVELASEHVAGSVVEASAAR
jgi:hypothetical protein